MRVRIVWKRPCVIQTPIGQQQHAADERLLPGAAPVDRSAVRACRSQLLELAALLCDSGHEVTPRGVLLSEQLLVDPSSPLFGRRDPGHLLQRIARVKAVLDGAQ